MKEYKIPTKFIFAGYFRIKCENKLQAKEYVEEHCGLVIGDIHSSLPDDQVDWEFDVHSKKVTGRITELK